jgi:hypothetical protein
MAAQDHVKTYYQDLEKGSYEGIIACFSKYAVVDSPIYGKMQASEVFKDLLQDSAKMKITLISVFSSIGKPSGVCAQYNCQWILKNSQFTSYEGVDVFQISPEGKIDKLSMFFDASKVREVWKKSGSRA